VSQERTGTLSFLDIVRIAGTSLSGAALVVRVYYDRDVDTNLIKDPATAGRFVIDAVCAAVAIWARH
jgi:hypothetical protein